MAARDVNHVCAECKTHKWPLHQACQLRHLDCARALLGNICVGVGPGSETNYHTHINQPDYDDWTPLMLACSNGCIELVKYLCSEANCDVNQTNNNGATPLYIASQKGHLEVVKYLCSEAKCDASQTNNNGSTPLLMASQQGHLDVVKYLCSEAKCDGSQTDKDGWTTLLMASHYHYICTSARYREIEHTQPTLRIVKRDSKASTVVEVTPVSVDAGATKT
jgi:ankyrin repeat protein